MNPAPADSAANSAKAAKRSRKVTGKPAADVAEAAGESSLPAATREAWKLDADLGIDHTASLREQLAGRIDDAEPVVFEAGDVQRIHTSTLQLLLMFCRDRRAAGRRTVWRNPSTSLQAAAKTVGLASSLELARDLS